MSESLPSGPSDYPSEGEGHQGPTPQEGPCNPNSSAGRDTLFIAIRDAFYRLRAATANYRLGPLESGIHMNDKTTQALRDALVERDRELIANSEPHMTHQDRDDIMTVNSSRFNFDDFQGLLAAHPFDEALRYHHFDPNAEK